MKLSVVLQRTAEDDDSPCAVEPLCLPEIGLFGVVRGIPGHAGPRPSLDAARSVIASLPSTLADAEPSERCRRTMLALQRALATSKDLALEAVVVALADERAFLASVGTCAAHRYQNGRYLPLSEVDALPGGPQGGYLVVTKVLSAAFYEDVVVRELPFGAGERMALVSPRVGRALAIASPGPSILGASLGGHALFLCELASDVVDPDACVVMVEASADDESATARS